MAKLMVVCGPTASGKTKLGILLAKELNGEVVSADSMQLYRTMDIGTAKPTLEEREGIPHHMLDVADPWEQYSVARYVEEATACVEDIFARGKQPIVVGGTGLYIDALCRGLDFADEMPESHYREQLQKQVAEQGMEPLLRRLAEVDPSSAAKLHPNDEKRIIRALEVFEATGKTITQHNQESQLRPPKYERATIGLSFADRARLRARIDLRVDEMMAQGLEQEVRGLLERGIPQSCTAMQAIGYKEMVRHLEEGNSPLEAAEEIKLRSRQYAKRQLSWFRRDSQIHWNLWGETPNFSSALQNSIPFLIAQGLK